MSRKSSRRTAGRSGTRNHSLRSQSSLGGSLDGRTFNGRRLRFEPLEDRRLLAVVTITTLSDTVDFNDGQTSLREAIFAANTVPGADTIEFAPALTAGGPAKILLTQGELAITDSLTIDGPGADLVTIDAHQQSRIFDIAPTGKYAAGPPKIDCTIAGLTITGGQASGVCAPFFPRFSGGAIRSPGNGMLTIHDCFVTGNVANGGSGGAVFARGDASITASTISGNISTGGDPTSVGFGGGVYSFGSVTLNQSTIRDNTGGGVVARGDVTLVGSMVSRNIGNPNAFRIGVFAGGVVTLHQSSVSGNSVNGDPAESHVRGAGIYAQSGVVIVDSTVSGNSGAVFGGGIFSGGYVSLSESTLSGNSSVTYGGGLLSSGDISIVESTIANNSAGGSGGGIFANSGVQQVTIIGSVVAGNSSLFGNSDIYSLHAPIQFSSSLLGDNSGTSLVEAAVGLPDANGNLIGGPVHGAIDPLLGPLADNGGFTLPDGSHILTMVPMPESPAINAGDPSAVEGQNGVPANDERGAPFPRVSGGIIDIGAVEYQFGGELILVVDTLVDESDGDYSRGDLSLREAIEINNVNFGLYSIKFDPMLTANGPATIQLTQGELVVTAPLAIYGPGANLLTIDASGNDPTPDVNNGDGSRVFDAEAGIGMLGVTVTGGDVTGDGGAIRALAIEELAEVVVRDNFAMGKGGGSSCSGSGPYLYDSSITGNIAGGTGGGIYSSAGFISVYGDISGNSAISGGGAFCADGDIVLFHATISGNTSSGNGGGIYSKGKAFIGYYSDFTQNRCGDAGGGVFHLGDLSLSNCTFSGNNAAGAGGGIYSQGGSMNADNCTISENVSGGGGGGIFRLGDMGATELSKSTITGNRSSYNGGGLAQYWGDFHLTESVVSGNSVNGYGSGGGLCLFGDNQTIDGSTVTMNNVYGSSYRGGGIYARSNVALHISKSIISGNVAAGDGSRGGGVAAIVPVLALQSSLIANNSAAFGGGVYVGHAYVNATIDGVTLTGNSATLDGGAICTSAGGLYGAGTELVVTNATLFANTAGRFGGGIFEGGSRYAPGEMDVTNCTIVRNQAALTDQLGGGGGIFVFSGHLALDQSIVADNLSYGAGPDFTGIIGVSITARYSFIGSNVGTGFASAPVGHPDSNGNLIGLAGNSTIDPRLGGLRDNGGPLLPDGTRLPTMAPYVNSPVTNAGDPSAVAGVSGVPASDERGAPFTRVFGGRIDMGAVEYEPSGFLAGDYNFDGIVDAADYTLWRDSRASNAVANGSGADGNGDGVVDDLDYGVWRTNFGATLPVAGGASVDALQVKEVQPPALPGVGAVAGSALAIETVPNKPPAEPEAGGVLVMRRPFDVAARRDLLFAGWIANRDANVSGRDSSGFDRPSSDAAPDEAAEGDIAAVDGAFALLDATM